MTKKIQRVEITTFYSTPICCPFCGSKVSDPEAGQSGEQWLHPCPHTLFVAHDEGFEYRSTHFNDSLGLPQAEEELEFPEDGIDALTDSVRMEDAIKFASYVGPPSFFGTYVGFAPTLDTVSG